MELSDKMKQEAISLGLCDKWTKEWRDNSSKEEMIDKYCRGIDFCIQHNYPSNEEIKEYFGDCIHKHGIYVDEKFDVKSNNFLVVNGKCNGCATYTNFDVGVIYLRHTSKLKLKVSGLARVSIEVYDNAVLEIEQDNSSNVYVYQHGGTINDLTGFAKIRDKR